jgi:hypothetical protein
MIDQNFQAARRKIKITTPVLLGIIFQNLLFTNSCLAKSQNERQAWILRQSSNFAGTVSSELTDNALKMRIGKLGLIIITKAPNWNALVFNENSKTFIDLPYKNWQNKFMLSGKSNYRDVNGKIALTTHNTGKNLVIDKFKTNEYLVVRKGEPDKNIPEEKISQLWIATDIKAPPQIAQIFCSHLGIPIQKGIPLRANRYANNKTVLVLDTISITRQKISYADFNALLGYKKVKDEIELIMGESTKRDMEDLLDVPSKSDLK